MALLRALSQPPARHALWLTLWTAAVMSAINAVMGLLTAYVLVRYNFPGRMLLSAIVDLPLAVPTLVTGLMLVVLFGPQRALGAWLNENLGWKIIFAPSGIILALLFTTFPFVVRSVQPVLASIGRDQEEAAATMGASPWLTFRRVTLPALSRALLSGTLLSMARAFGEFGSIVIVSGNIPMRTQTAAVYVLGEIESDNQRGASAMSLIMILICFTLILVVERLQERKQPELR